MCLAQHDRQAGGVPGGCHPSIPLVAAGPAALGEFRESSSVGLVVASIERASARSAAALISALLICRATGRGLVFSGGGRSLWSVLLIGVGSPLCANKHP